MSRPNHDEVEGGATASPRYPNETMETRDVVNAHSPRLPLLDAHSSGGAQAPHHPVNARINAERAADFQLRLADRITAFAGSMPFVYLHVFVFAMWMLVFEKSPWPTLTLAVSLEAIFLSTFVMIGQNRQAAFQQAKADHEFAEEEQELKLNTQLTREIHELTRQVHEHVVGAAGEGQPRGMPMGR